MHVVIKRTASISRKKHEHTCLFRLERFLDNIGLTVEGVGGFGVIFGPILCLKLTYFIVKV